MCVSLIGLAIHMSARVFICLLLLCSVSLHVCFFDLFVYLSTRICVCLSVFRLLNVCMCFLWSVGESLFIYLCLYQSVCLCFSVCLSLFVHLSVCSSITTLCPFPPRSRWARGKAGSEPGWWGAWPCSPPIRSRPRTPPRGATLTWKLPSLRTLARPPFLPMKLYGEALPYFTNNATEIA